MSGERQDAPQAPRAPQHVTAVAIVALIGPALGALGVVWAGGASQQVLAEHERRLAAIERNLERRDDQIADLARGVAVALERLENMARRIDGPPPPRGHGEP